MYCTGISVRSTHQAEKAPALFWDIVRAESKEYFPSLELIKLALHSVTEVIEWGRKKDPMYQFRLSYEEAMIAELDTEPHVFWLRGTRHASNAELPVDIRLLYDEQKDLWLSVMLQFGKRGSMDYAAELLKKLREGANGQGIDYNHLDLVVTGYKERARDAFIRETNLVTFVQGVRGRLVHRSEGDLVDRSQFG